MSSSAFKIRVHSHLMRNSGKSLQLAFSGISINYFSTIGQVGSSQEKGQKQRTIKKKKP